MTSSPSSSTATSGCSTGRRPEKAFYLDNVLQLAAARFADYMLDDEGLPEQVLLPTIDRTGIVNVRADGYDLVPVDADERAFAVFRAVRIVGDFADYQRRENWIGDAILPPTGRRRRRRAVPTPSSPAPARAQPPAPAPHPFTSALIGRPSMATPPARRATRNASSLPSSSACSWRDSASAPDEPRGRRLPRGGRTRMTVMPFNPPPPQGGRLSLIDSMDDVFSMAETVADTDFVPRGLRGNPKPRPSPADPLYGREIGLELADDVALDNQRVIEGKPSLSAEAQRAPSILAAGHELSDRRVDDDARSRRRPPP